MATSFPIAKPLSTPSRAGIGGPKSPAGKARSAANAVKHGLSSANPVILEYETAEAWEAFRDTFTADLHPVGQVEEELARELALTQWRRRRIPAYEARCADRRLQTAIASLEYYSERESQQALEERARVVLNEALLPNTEELTRLLRYEAHLDRKFTQTLRHLHRLQQTRKQEQEAEQCKTNSAPRLPVPATSVPCVPSVPSTPFHNPPAAENCKTNSPAPPPIPADPTPTPTPTLPPPNHPPAEECKTNSTPTSWPAPQQAPPGYGRATSEAWTRSAQEALANHRVGENKRFALSRSDVLARQVPGSRAER